MVNGCAMNLAEGPFLFATRFLDENCPDRPTARRRGVQKKIRAEQTAANLVYEIGKT